MVDGPADVSVVVPTIGRPALSRLLASMAAADGPLPEAVILIDDRPDGDGVPLLATTPARLRGRVRVVSSRAGGDDRDGSPGGGRGGGPAAARNVGWRLSSTEWVTFLDDDVEVVSPWLADLAQDLARATPDVAGVQGRVEVPTSEPPTDWERNVAGLARARWATADMAYRRTALEAVGGFDERFPRAYREDADLGLRVSEQVGRIVRGRRRVRHPAGSAPAWISVRRQAGNADDALMLRLHGRGWRERAGVPRGRRPRHLAVTLAGLAAVALLPVHRRAGAVAGAVWMGGTAELIRARVAPGPKTPREVATMVATSLAIPPAASAHWVRGMWRWRKAQRHSPEQPAPTPRPDAVLFDRDGTLIVDRPYNGDPEMVEPMPGAAEAVAAVRSAGVAAGVVSNQSGVARGLLTLADVDAINARVQALLGPFDAWAICPHEPGAACACRKPAGGLVTDAAQRLHADPRRCVVIGDIGADAEAAHAAGARAVLVPTPATVGEELELADRVADDLAGAVAIALEGRWRA